MHALYTRSRRGGPGVSRLLYAILFFGILLLLIPSSWLFHLFGVGEAAVLSQRILPNGNLSGFGEPIPETLTIEEFQQMRTRDVLLLNQLAAYAAKIKELEMEKELLLQSRRLGIGTSGRLLEARITTQDPAGWRDAGFIQLGAASSLRPSNLVLSRHFTLEMDDTTTAMGGLGVMLGESLLGVVDEVYLTGARVVWLTDPGFEMEAIIGQESPEGVQIVGKRHWMRGIGNGQFELIDVELRESTEGRIRPGDLVLAQPQGIPLPGALRVGTIATVLPRKDQPLLCRVLVNALIPSNRLDKVYVYAP